MSDEKRCNHCGEPAPCGYHGPAHGDHDEEDVPEQTGLQVLEELAADMLQCMMAVDLLLEQQISLRLELVHAGVLKALPDVGPDAD